MFKLVLFCAIVGLASALSVFGKKEVEVLKLVNDVRPDGFDYALETTNTIVSQRSGDKNGNIQGVERWVSPKGVEVLIKYVANENGYQPQGELLPTPPPIPEAIVRSLKWIEANPSKE